MKKAETKKSTKKAETKKSTKKGAYTLEVSVNDVVYKGSGENMVDALSKFVASPEFPFAVKTQVSMNFSDGKRKGIQRYPALMGRRTFNAISFKPSAIEILAGDMERRLA